MGEKDLSEKILFDYNDVFSDIVNVLLFGGRRVVFEDDLVNAGVHSMYKADDSKLHEEERDVAKIWTKGDVQLAICGIENQTRIEKAMPLRIIGYDGASYRAQLLSSKAGPFIPVVTVVLNFSNSRWDQPKNLKGLLTIPPELDKYVNDYKIQVFDIAYLADEQIKAFRSDFRVVADFFVKTRRDKNYLPSNDVIEHVNEVLKLFSVVKKDDRYMDILSTLKKKDGEITMCDVLQGWIDKGEAVGLEKGRKEGREEGREEGRLDMLFANVKALLDGGTMTLVQIMDVLKLSDADREAVSAYFTK